MTKLEKKGNSHVFDTLLVFEVTGFQIRIWEHFMGVGIRDGV
jgi:hypothetical protein